MAKSNQFTEKMLRFCSEYAISLNGTKAAIAAGYSESGASVTASRLLKNPKIKEEIAKLLSKSKQRVNLKLDDVLNELKQLAFANIADVCSWDAKTVAMIPSGRLDPGILASIKSVGEFISQGGVSQIRIQMHDKLRACELILKVFEISELEARLLALEERVSGK